jgi:exonuclease V
VSRALSEADKASESLEKAKGRAKDLVEDNRPPILRFRTFPMKPFSVSDLTAGSWCELQYYYTLTQLPGGRKTRTAAMKRGSEVHEKLEREVYTPVQIDVTKKEDVFGLKIWNTIQGLRVLRDTGLTRELEVWGMVDGNVVNGVIDGLSYENPDPESEEEVLSSRGSSQTVTNSQMTDPGTPYNKGRDYEIYITDVKTRTTAAPPSQAQVRVAIIQLFLYHRFLTQMATDQLDYLRVFERYGLNPDEPFSDSFMAQIGAIHGEIFADIDAETSSASSFSGASSELSNGLENGGFVSAPSSPSQLSSFDLAEDGESSSPSHSRKLKYRTLRALLALLKFEIHLTFPRGAADLGQIVAVEYRYRSREDRTTTTTTSAEPETSPEEADASSSGKRRRRSTPGNGPGPVQPEDGSVICTNTFFVEPHTLDLYLEETMRWWKGEREPHGVPLEEAFKCRSCEFVEGCEWRRKLDMEAIKKAKVKKMMRADKGEDG